MPKHGNKKKQKYSDLADDERCIYQAVGDLEGGDASNHCTLVLKGGAAEVDDEAAMVVLAKHYSYDGPHFCLGSNFGDLEFDEGAKILAICTGSNLKKFVIEATSQDMAKLLMDPSNTAGVAFHAIGIKIVDGSQVVHDQQGLRKNGPNAKDDVIYWKK